MKGNSNGLFSNACYYISFNNKINDALGIFIFGRHEKKNTVTTNVTVFIPVRTE